MQDQDLDQVKTDLSSHLIECAENYSELKAETEIQNSKIDALSEQVRGLVKVIVAACGWLVVSLTSAIAYLVNHFIK